MHDRHAEIQSVSARLEQTRDEVIPLLNQIAATLRREGTLVWLVCRAHLMYLSQDYRPVFRVVSYSLLQVLLVLDLKTLWFLPQSYHHQAASSPKVSCPSVTVKNQNGSVHHCSPRNGRRLPSFLHLHL